MRKFVQTFILAQQSNGYFVLNDIFRYLNEMEVEEQEAPVAEPVAEQAPEAIEEPVAAAEPEVPKVEEPVVNEPKPAAIDADLVDKKLESALASESADQAPTTNGNGLTAEAEKKKEDAPASVAEPEASLTPEVVEKELEEEVVKEQEKPKDPSPTPASVAAAPKAKPATPAAPSAPAKPLSWASLAAGTPAGKPVPVVPASAKAAPRPAQPRAAPTAPASASATAPQPSKPTPPASESAEKDSNVWQTAGSNQKQNSRSVASPGIKEDTLGYVRNVTEKVNVDELRSTLAKFGELVYFDVNRSKVRFCIKNNLYHTD